MSTERYTQKVENKSISCKTFSLTQHSLESHKHANNTNENSCWEFKKQIWVKEKTYKHKSGMCATWKFKSRLKIKCFCGSFKTAVALASYVHLSFSRCRLFVGTIYCTHNPHLARWKSGEISWEKSRGALRLTRKHDFSLEIFLRWIKIKLNFVMEKTWKEFKTKHVYLRNEN